MTNNNTKQTGQKNKIVPISKYQFTWYNLISLSRPNLAVFRLFFSLIQ